MFLGIILFPISSAVAQQWDWHISGGTVADGSGTEAYEADLLVRGDSIGFVGKVNPDTIEVLHHVDASGYIVSPGFIDVHAHGNPMDTPEFKNFLAMGVTSIVLGQDGSSPAGIPMAEWFDQVEKARPAVNTAGLTGHGSLRQWAGTGLDEASDREIDRMEALLKADLQSGAWGMSTGLEYVPGMYAGDEELKPLARIVGEHNGIVMSHMRSENNEDIKASLNELAEQGKYARVHASHLKVVYGKGAERAEEVLEYLEKHNESGIKLTADTYPYAASYTGIAIVFPEWAKTTDQWKQAVKERPDVLRRYLQDKVERRNGPGAILFGSGPHAGQTLKDVAQKQSRSYLDVLMDRGPRAASAAHFVMNEELQDRIAVASGVMISSDGSPGMHHPRGYGSFAKVIHRFVIEQQALALEEAIHKMSRLPASTMGFEKRGLIREGYKADLLMFKPEEIQDLATFEQPHQLAKGFRWIWVNGQIVRRNGEFTEQRRGKVLKMKPKVISTN